MLVEVSIKDFEKFVEIYKKDPSLKVLCAGDCLILFKVNSIIANVANDRCFLSEEFVNKIRSFTLS